MRSSIRDSLLIVPNRNVAARCSPADCSEYPGVLPEPERNRQRIDVERGPPRPLVTLPVKLAMVDAAQRHRELIRYPAAECARLREPKVVSLAGLPPAYGARLNRNKAKMIFVAMAAQLRRCEVIGSFDAHSRSLAFSLVLGAAHEHTSVS